MNNVNNICFFGCSFTAVEGSVTGYEFKNYRKIIREKLECNSFNYSRSGKSNEEIINDVYCISKNYENSKNTLFVIQTTFTNRLGLYFDLMNKFESICKTENPDSETEKIFIDFYNDWLKYFYNKKLQLLEFEKSIDFLSAWLNKLNIPFIIIGIDESLDTLKNNSFFEKNNFLDFESNKSFYNYATLNKLRICDLVIIENQIKDYHFNQKGHDILAEKIIKIIKT